MAALPKKYQPANIAFSNGVLLRIIDGNLVGIPLRLSIFSSKQRVIRWLQGDDTECVVCFEESNQFVNCTKCAYRTCVSCFVDLLSLSETEMALACPNCRHECDALINLMMLLKFVDIFFDQSESESEFKSMTDFLTLPQLEFINKMTGVDLSLRRDSYKVQRGKHLIVLETFLKIPNSDRIHEWPPETLAAAYRELRRDLERMRDVSSEQMSTMERLRVEHMSAAELGGMSREVFESLVKKKDASVDSSSVAKKKKVARASADSSSAAASHPRFGCANCGKQFWDKSEWKRAPKCLKCKRTAYCCAKCRKAHWKTHASECVAAKKGKRRAKKKKPRKGHDCAPY